MFLTPVGKIDDSDTKHSNEIDVPKRIRINKQTHPNKWGAIVKALSEGTPMEEIEKHFILTDIQKQQLIDETNGNK